MLIKRNRELVNFADLAPHLITQGLLNNDEWLDITSRNNISSQNHFKIFLTDYLINYDKRNIVQKFFTALQNAKSHKGHEDLLKILEKDERLMKAIGNIGFGVYYQLIHMYIYSYAGVFLENKLHKRNQLRLEIIGTLYIGGSFKRPNFHNKSLSNMFTM